jgi:hypothetical protein|tara:strand:- start:1560 stop:1796 length:237 start_codon:yes stop_codon:yes gene_type:complete
MDLKIKGHPDLVKDKFSGAVLSNNRAAYAAVKRRHQNLKDQKDQIEEQSKEINIIKTELTEIKNLLVALVDGRIDDGK